ncbi:molybdopterin synthase [Halanaeroarchaeum sulfurireducens]|uniref:Bifunctional molybdopterin-guanine dinucleotide biosynthesis protein MobB/MoaE n=1 Tax=Halanaeroarchaeum sulfurireducens TaxID=1604004 RepID=A0A0F7PFV9_9EURY|nr:molybdopterin synthase [Halanaeroarchaeum sulfurireducens]AKH98434.1 bifunctional molybdopterin-guanine dinucleotide biosynthesis protein MobB/MoaE [Halanaeroarchaeum sulfurireducens]
MQVLGIATGSTDPDTVLGDLAPRLRERGRVAIVRADDDGFSVAAEGWEAAGEALSFEDVMDRAARDHDYCLVVGVHDGSFPYVTDGEVDVPDPALALEQGDVDVEAALDAIEDGEPHETLGSLVDEIEDSGRADYAGAIATFTGRVRAMEDEDDDYTTSLTFEKYDGVAEDRMAAIEADLESREGVEEVLVHHRVGRIEAGEDIVFVVVLAGHRGQAFRAVEDGIDQLKDEVPIFKKEITTDESFWVHERH